jgi:endonuclease YncB( thermonuclease family)
VRALFIANIIPLLFLGAAQAQPLICRAIDGDTIACGEERIRLVDIYAPELGEPGGQLAREKLRQRLEAGAIEIRRHGRDRYGRTLGDVYVDGVRVIQRGVGRLGGRGLPAR